MDEEFIDEAGWAGVTAINLAVDCVAPRKGMPKDPEACPDGLTLTTKR